MPGRRQSKEKRSKICAVYLRPWTLFPYGGTVDVPFLSDLQFTRAQLQRRAQEDRTGCDELEIGDIRAAWKDYTRRTLPHAFTQIRNFMLASIAEGRNFEEEEESMKRGGALRCSLSLADVEKALTFRGPASAASAAHEDQDKEKEIKPQRPKADISTEIAVFDVIHILYSWKSVNFTKFYGIHDHY